MDSSEWTIPGWRAWPRQILEPSPQDLLPSTQDLGPILKPLVADVVVMEEPPPPIVKQAEAPVSTSLVTHLPSNEIVIRLKWDYIAYAIAILLMVYMLYQFSYMHSRILILVTTLASRGRV